MLNFGCFAISLSDSVVEISKEILEIFDIQIRGICNLIDRQLHRMKENPLEKVVSELQSLILLLLLIKITTIVTFRSFRGPRFF